MRGIRNGTGIPSLMMAVFAVWMFVAYQHVGGAAAAQVATQGSDQAQIEKGRQAVGQACAPCHANILRVVQIHRKSAAEWRDTVYSMIGRGAQILPEEIEPLTAFLAATAGRTQPSPTTPATSASRSAASPQAPAADSEGKALLGRLCVRCHDLEAATRKPAGDDWKAVIARMVTYGAEVGPADRQKLIDYLNGLTQ